MIYIFIAGLFLNLGVLSLWLFISDWKFSLDDYLFVTFTTINIIAFAIAIKAFI